MSLRELEIQDIDSNNLSVYSAVSKCLMTVFEVIGNEAIEITTEFISTFMNNNDWKDKCAGMSALSYLLIGISPEQADRLLR